MTIPVEIDAKARPLSGRLGLNAILVLAMLVPLAIGLCTGNALTTRLASADTLWTLAFLQDISLHGGRLADWNFGQHTDLFPDKLFSAIAYAVSDRPERWLLVFEALNLALYFAIAWYCLWLCLSRWHEYRLTWCIALWGALVVTAVPMLLRSWGLFDLYLRYIGIPSNHFGPYFCAILGTFIAIDCFERPANGRMIARVSVACTLMLLTGMSDKLAIVVAVPGFLVAALYVATMRRGFPAVLLGCVGAFCATAALSYFANDPFWSAMVDLTPAKPAFDASWIKLMIRPMLRSLLDRPDSVANIETNDAPSLHDWPDWIGLSDFLAHLDPVRIAISAAGLLTAVGLASAYGGRAASALLGRLRVPAAHVTADAFIVYLVTSFFLIPAALLMAGVLVERYAYPAGYCILWAVVATLGRRIPPAASLSRLAIGIAATGALLSVMPVNFSAPPFRRLSNPPLVRCLEEFGKTRDLRLGLASHWETYPVDLFSQGRILVRTITRDGLISHWVDNIDWYSPAAGRLFTFVIASPYIDEPALSQRIGDPTDVLSCTSLGPGFGERQILYYDRAAATRLTAWITQQYQVLKQ